MCFRQQSTPLTSPLLAAVVQIAKQEIGVLEVPAGSNSGPRVNEYLHSVNLGPGYAWCAAFVYWCFEQASAQLNRVNPLVKTGGCLQHWRVTKGLRITPDEAVVDPSRIVPGSVFIINCGKGKGHTGLVVSVDDGCIGTIEGNTNTHHSANGVGVFGLTRKITDVNGGFIIYS
jgi:hypothetical protein